MRDFKNWSYFNYDAGRYLPWGWKWGTPEEDEDFIPYKPDSINTVTKKLTWYVFNEENGEVIPVDIFRYNWVFLEDLLTIKKKYGTDFIKFADATRSALQHQYWGRSEYETIITSWPPYIDEKELNRLNKEREEHKKKYPKSNLSCQSVACKCSHKLDIYNQIMLNWDVFIKYVWDNKHLITRKKLGLD